MPPLLKPRFQSAFLGLVILAAGVVVGYWLAERPLPPVPPSGSKLSDGPSPQSRLEPAQREAFEKGLADLQPQVEAFQKGFAALDAAYHARLDALLTDAQRAKLVPARDIDWVSDFNLLARTRVGLPGLTGTPGAENDPDHTRLMFMVVLRIVMYEPTLRILTEKLQLSPTQQAQARVALEERRQAFLKLAQENPLPVDRLYVLLRDLGLLPRPLPPAPLTPVTPPAPAKP